MSARLTYTSGAVGTETQTQFETHLDAARGAAGDPLTHLINGEQVREGRVFEREDPARVRETASRAYQATAGVVVRAVQAARTAQTDWRHVSHRDRCRRLRAGASAIESRHLEIAAVVSLETGKTRAEAIAEVQEGIDLITTYCDFMERSDGFTAPLASLVKGEVNTDVLRPYGVFGVISPFNFPFALTIGMATAALVAGNTVVLKPSEEAPWSAALVVETLSPQLPPGVVNLVHGDGEAGRELVESEVDGIAFTGSAEVGREIARKLQMGPYARPALTEMGGKNPAIVTDRADVEKAAEGVARAAFGLSGQKCSACSRAIVLPGVYDEFLSRLVGYTQSLAIGDPGDGGVFLGPVINAGSLQRYRSVVASAREDGTVLVGGADNDSVGYFVEPTVVSELPTGHDLTRRELFLPFVTVERAATLADAIEGANAPVYGLTAGIFTDDDEEIVQFMDTIQAGVVYVNRRAGATTGAWPGTQSFCGWKSSGSTGKGGLGPHYVPQFMREQSRTVVG